MVVGKSSPNCALNWRRALEVCLSALMASRPQAHSTDKSVDLSVSLAIDHPSCLSFCRTSGGSGKATAAVPVLDGLDVPEITRDPVELRPGGAHNSPSLAERSARMMRSTIVLS